jgi:hypothetical protein
VIRIRYEDFSAGTHDVTGWHGKAVRGPRGVTLSLLPGLTAGQRRAVIRRLRQEASRGFGPPLPAPQLAVALGLDRLRAAAGTVRAIVRLHPVVTLVPGAFATVVMALFVIASAAGPGGPAAARAGLAGAPAAGGGTALVGAEADLQAAAAGQPDMVRIVLHTVWAGNRRAASGPGRGARGGRGREHRRHHQVRARADAWYVYAGPVTGPVLRRCVD